jgi:ABC-type uncharacterized transport system permease subunit
VDNATLIGLASIFATAAPVIFAAIGETFSERAGVINLSVNGTILLSAMGSFAVVVETQSLALGFLAGALIGALIALVVAFSSISLKQSQVAVGFVLAMTCRDLAYFLGESYTDKVGLLVPSAPIPGLKDIPVVGTLFFSHDWITYASYFLIFLAFIYIFKTRAGLMLRGIGERPAAAYVRGANVNLQRYLYTVLGGALVGLAGPMYSLCIKSGWKGTLSGLDGIGWIALAITIFGAWSPLRVAFGAYLFAFLQWFGLTLQSVLPGVPQQVFQVAPFPLMILTLVLVNIGNAEWVERVMAGMPDRVRHAFMRFFRALRSSPPASLGVPFEKE